MPKVQRMQKATQKKVKAVTKWAKMAKRTKKVSFYNIASEASYFFAKVVFGAKIQKRYFSDVMFWWF